MKNKQYNRLEYVSTICGNRLIVFKIHLVNTEAISCGESDRERERLFFYSFAFRDVLLLILRRIGLALEVCLRYFPVICYFDKTVYFLQFHSNVRLSYPVFYFTPLHSSGSFYSAENNVHTGILTPLFFLCYMPPKTCDLFPKYYRICTKFRTEGSRNARFVPRFNFILDKNRLPS